MRLVAPNISWIFTLGGEWRQRWQGLFWQPNTLQFAIEVSRRSAHFQLHIFSCSFRLSKREFPESWVRPTQSHGRALECLWVLVLNAGRTPYHRRGPVVMAKYLHSIYMAGIGALCGCTPYYLFGCFSLRIRLSLARTSGLNLWFCLEHHLSNGREPGTFLFALRLRIPAWTIRMKKIALLHISNKKQKQPNLLSHLFLIHILAHLSSRRKLGGLN